MRVLWVFVGAGSGLAIGIVLGLAFALVAMSLTSRRDDGTYGIREMITCLPLGSMTGLTLGIMWGVHLAGV